MRKYDGGMGWRVVVMNVSERGIQSISVRVL